MAGSAGAEAGRGGLRAASLLEATAVVAVGAMAAVAASIVLGVSSPAPLLAAQGAVPWLLAPAYVVLVGAAVKRRRALAAASAVLVAAHLWLCVPAATADAQPQWAGRAPAFTLYSANVRFDNPDPDGVARSLMKSDADVVVVIEMNDRLDAALESLGAYRRYPTVVRAHGHPFGEMVMTRLPVESSERIRLGGFIVPSVVVRVGHSPVRVMAVHSPAPAKRDGETKSWWANLEQVRRLALQESTVQPVVLSGDFNASSWNEPMREMESTGLDDAHDALGEGLSGSWSPLSIARTIGPLIRLDHCLTTEGVVATRVRDSTTPGSDHTPFDVTLAVRQPADRAGADRR